VVDRETGMTRIHGLTVCVDYAAELAIGLPRWIPGLASLTVITTHRDADTIALVRGDGSPRAELVITDLFYRDGAAFNKGRALEAARSDLAARLTGDPGWLLLFDADVVPPADWAARLEGTLEPGTLYGCRRFPATPATLEDYGQPAIPCDVPGVGYFQLFHQWDPVVVGVDPLIEVDWIHAGNYYNRLMDRWRQAKRPIRDVRFRVAHLGPRENWYGRGRRAEFLAMQAERRRRGGRWDHERIGGAS
jgi:hypothetical protein